MTVRLSRDETIVPNGNASYCLTDCYVLRNTENGGKAKRCNTIIGSHTRNVRDGHSTYPEASFTRMRNS